MRIAVIGAGLAGVTTAHELARDGHEVHVFDRGSGIATEASFANGGLMAPEYLAAWGAPGLPRRLMSPPWRERAAGWQGLRSPAAWGWLWRWWRAQRAAGRPAQRGALLALGQLSRERAEQLGRQLALEHEQTPGQLVLLRDERDLKSLQRGLDWLAEAGVAHTMLDADGARRHEPALNPNTPLLGAVHFPGAVAANSRQFAHRLKQETRQAGVHWHFLHEVAAIAAGQPMRLQTRALPSGLAGTDQAPPSQATQALDVDAVVLCAGAGGPALLATQGLRLPLLAIDGHSITASARIDEAHDSQLPRAGILDERSQVSIVRQGDRLRVAGGATLGGPRTTVDAHALEHLYRVLDDWFPGAARTATALQWRGSRWAVPDGLPVIGASGVPGLWLNLGLGGGGWTLACGSAKCLADQIAGRAPPFDTGPLGLARLR